jgi:pyruvate dehydrogenase phosphatase
LADLYHVEKERDSYNAHPNNEKIEGAIKEAYNALDSDIVNGTLPNALSSVTPLSDVRPYLAPAQAGSCALMVFYDSYSRWLHVVRAGDSRAVLGRPIQTESGDISYEVHVLTESVDHNKGGLAEKERVAAQHPGKSVAKDSQVLETGLPPVINGARHTRSQDTRYTSQEEHLDKSSPPNMDVPPCVPAEPDFRAFQIKPGDFVVLATSGLWETLTVEDAVGLVGQWLARKMSQSNTSSTGKATLKQLSMCRALSENGIKEQEIVRYEKCRSTVTKESVKWSDKNVATHLIGNSIRLSSRDRMPPLPNSERPKTTPHMCVLEFFFF